MCWFSTRSFSLYISFLQLYLMPGNCSSALAHFYFLKSDLGDGNSITSYMFCIWSLVLILKFLKSSIWAFLLIPESLSNHFFSSLLDNFRYWNFLLSFWKRLNFLLDLSALLGYLYRLYFQGLLHSTLGDNYMFLLWCFVANARSFYIHF